MKLERITLRQIRMPLVHFFETSFSRTYSRDIILVEAVCEGISGWGEVTAGENPFYNEEWTDSAWMILRDYAAPRVLGRELQGAEDVYPLTSHIRGHNMARGAWRQPYGTWRRAWKACRCGRRLGAEQGARSPAEFPSVYRARWSNCWRRSSVNLRTATSASR